MPGGVRVAILPIRRRSRRALSPNAARRRGAAVAAFGAVLTLTLAFAPTATAAGLSLTTPYPSVSVAPGSKVSFDIAITGNANEQVAISVAGTPTDWTATLRGGGYVINGVQTDASGKASASLDLQVPATAADGATTVTVQGVAGSVRADLPLTISVSSKAGGDVTLSSDFPSLRGASGTTFTFNLTLRNESAEDLTFAVTGVGPTNWEVNATLTGQTQAASAVVKASGTAAVSVSAKAPTDAAPGTYPINVRATVGDRTIDAKLSVEVTGTNAMTVTTPDQRLSNSGSAGGSISQQLVIRNDGTQPLQQVVVSATAPTDWKVTFDPSATIDSVAAGESKTITANIVPSNDAIAGDYVITYSARATDANGTVDIRMTIETSPLFGFVGLALIALTKRYGELLAVDGLDLELRRGEIFGLLGQNGAGKTTTILMLLGLTEPTSGSARVMGLDPARDALRVKRQVGYLPDSVGFYGDLTGRQNLRYTARLNGLARDEIEGKIDEALEQVSLSDRGDSRAETYSRGMLQRLGIADALIKDPEILILDEPTAAIDPIGVVEILQLLNDLVRERGVTVLLSSHLLTQVQSVCDRVGIFAAGRLIGQGTVPELAARFGNDTGQVEVTFEGERGPGAADRIRPILGDIPHVEKVDSGTGPDDPWILTVRPMSAGRQVREAVLAIAARDGLGLTAIRSTEASLDEIYRTAVHQAGLHPAPPDATPAGAVA
jgi:ABC-2 type transport system ATP-binding protein